MAIVIDNLLRTGPPVFVQDQTTTSIFPAFLKKITTTESSANFSPESNGPDSSNMVPKELIQHFTCKVSIKLFAQTSL